MADAERESTGCVLGVAFGLVVLVGLVASLAFVGLKRADGDALLTQWFEPAELPFGLVVAEATASRERDVVVLEDPDAPEEAPRAEEPEETDEDGGPGEGDGPGDDDGEPVDWSAIPVGPADTPPLAVALIHYKSRGAALSQIERLFAPPPEGDRGEEPSFTHSELGSHGGRAVMDRGRLPWHGYSILFVHERELEFGGTFRDVVRVNLSLPGRYLVGHVRWPRGLPASKERVVELLGALRPRP